MMKLMAQVRAFARRRSGATAIEYALIGGGVCLAIVAAVGVLGESLLDMFNSVAPAFAGVG